MSAGYGIRVRSEEVEERKGRDLGEKDRDEVGVRYGNRHRSTEGEREGRIRENQGEMGVTRSGSSEWNVRG